MDGAVHLLNWVDIYLSEERLPYRWS